jgi:hypothetical protein
MQAASLRRGLLYYAEQAFVANNNTQSAGPNTQSSKPAAEPAVDPKMMEVLARLDAAEARAKEMEARAAQAEADLQQQLQSGLRVLPSKSGPMTGPEGGYLFEIGPANPDKYPHLKVIKQKACDESEMIRWYCATHEDPPASNKQVDPLNVQLKVRCLEENSRKNLLIRLQRIASLRHRVAQGHVITAEEAAMLEQYEASQI